VVNAGQMVEFMKIYTISDLETLYSDHWRAGFGSIAKDEVLFVQALIEAHKPKTFLEIGMASGLSGGIIANILEENGGEVFTTIDHDNTFFADPAKENGFLIDRIFTGKRLKIDKLPFTTSLDLARVGARFEMAFIDANHQHPWPTIDTLCLFPYLDGSRIIIHHDYCLFRNQDIVYGIGPKYLFDQFSPTERILSNANNGNIFALKLDSVSTAELTEIAIDSFYLPWSLRHPLKPEMVDKILGVFSEHYSDDLCETFQKCVNKFNELERLRVGV